MKNIYTTIILHGIKKGYWTKENYPKQIKLNDREGIEKKVESKIPNHSHKLTFIEMKDKNKSCSHSYKLTFIEMKVESKILNHSYKLTFIEMKGGKK